MPPSQARGGGMTHKSHFAVLDERLGGEPFPHESARGSVVDRIDQPMNVVVDETEVGIVLFLGSGNQECG